MWLITEKLGAST